MGKLRNPPADLSEFSSELQDGDRVLTNDELSVLSLFANLDVRIGADSNPGSAVLRKCRPGRVLCEQADAGASAFYILTAADVRLLLQMQELLLEEQHYAEETAAIDAAVADDLRRRKAALTDEASEAARALLAEAVSASDEEFSQPQVAEARLLTPVQVARRKPGFWKKFLAPLLKRGTERRSRSFIPLDGPSGVSEVRRVAPLHEGDVFGEMSCLRRVPRSATVVTTEECYILEMLLVIFRKAQSDQVFRERMDAVYRSRTLQSHLRQFSFFAQLSDAEFESIRNDLSLHTFTEGDVLFDEFEESTDYAYVIRSGLVQVRKGMNLLFGRDQISEERWNEVGRQLGEWLAAGEASAVLTASLFPDDLQDALSGSTTAALSQGNRLRLALNEFIRDADLAAAISRQLPVKTVGDLLEALSIPHDVRQIPDLNLKISEMSQVSWRVIRRMLLESACPELPRRSRSLIYSRTLTYLGSGSHIGEMGVLRGDPRNATCIAFEDELGAGKENSRNIVEAVRLSGETLRFVARSNPAVAKAIDKVVLQYEEQNKAPVQVEEARDFFSREMDELRIVEGQNLLLVDLDRCTRCGECINACVDSHDDGLTRLYLEGQRVGNYLIPMACRECVDPYCMRNCPVSAIYRGADGEMNITEWCIGCQKCADDCPFGSIHMNPVEQGSDARPDQDGEFRVVTQQATVCDLCAATPSQDPSCVYACPHDAAIRVDGREFYNTFRP